MKVLLVLFVAVASPALVDGLKRAPHVPHTNITSALEITPFKEYTQQDYRWRFMVYALIRKADRDFDFCSGVLVKADLILSSAHCYYYAHLQPKDILMIGGRVNLMGTVALIKDVGFYSHIIDDSKFGTEINRVIEIHIPSNYNNDTLLHDIALLKTSANFSKIKTKLISWSLAKMMHQRECTVAGFGLGTGFPPKAVIGFIENIMAMPVHLRKCDVDPKVPLLCIKSDTAGGCLEHSGGPMICQGVVNGVGTVAYYENCENSDPELFFSALYEDREWLMSVYLDANTQVSVNSGFKLTVFTIFFMAFWQFIFTLIGL